MWYVVDMITDFNIILPESCSFFPQLYFHRCKSCYFFLSCFINMIIYYFFFTYFLISTVYSCVIIYTWIIALELKAGSFLYKWAFFSNFITLQLFFSSLIFIYINFNFWIYIFLFTFENSFFNCFMLLLFISSF